MGDDIQATRTHSTTDWDDTLTCRFRRRFLGLRPLPSVDEFERVILEMVGSN
jgi:hypothetical protein